MNSKIKDGGISIVIISACLLFILLRGGFAGTGSLNKEVNEEAEREIASLNIPAIKNQEPIILFMTSWCGQCKTLIRTLNKNELAFEVYDIERDIVGQNLYRKVMGSHSGPVPVTVVGKKVFVGNQSNAIVNAAKIKESIT